MVMGDITVLSSAETAAVILRFSLCDGVFCKRCMLPERDANVTLMIFPGLSVSLNNAHLQIHLPSATW
jgi:hypothetical protein